jgi:hypothetical protein
MYNYLTTKDVQSNCQEMANDLSEALLSWPTQHSRTRINSPTPCGARIRGLRLNLSPQLNCEFNRDIPNPVGQSGPIAIDNRADRLQNSNNRIQSDTSILNPLPSLQPSALALLSLSTADTASSILLFSSSLGPPAV